MELLSPAGNLSSAYAALKGGADAIYFGGKQFSARASAENFTNEEIEEIVHFSHAINKKVYVTLNTLLYQDEFFEAVEFAKFLYSIGIDGLIIQDLGLANYLHKTLPNLPLNASTQLNCHNVQQAKALIKLGFKRIVLARETSIETIREIKKLGVEIEVFGHGALCVSYSGNCLMSSFIGQRSGNRGKCAQPCRMLYDLLENGKKLTTSFAISTKDLMTLEEIPELINARIDSLKIEGRLKSEDYIYTVSKAYREAIDAYLAAKESYINKDNKDDLIKLFNRKFTKGFLFNETPFNTLNTKTSSHQGIKIGTIIGTSKNRLLVKLSNQLHRLDGVRINNKDQIGFTVEKIFLNKEAVEEAFENQIIELSGIENANKYKKCELIKTKDYLLSKRINDELKQSFRIPIKAKFKAKIGEKIELTISYLNKTFCFKGCVAEKAINNGTSKERIIEQFSKSGNFPYSLKFEEIDIENCFIPISEINSLRNESLNKLFDSFKINMKVNLNEYSSSFNKLETNNTIRAICENKSQENICLNNGIDAYINKGYNCNHNRINSSIELSYSSNIVHSLLIKEKETNLIASQYCNITNSYALDCFYEFGFNECICSSELNIESIKSMLDDFENRHHFKANVGYIIYGKIDMMIMKSCPIGTYFHNSKIHCNRCKSNYYSLVDRIGEKYDLISDENCNTRVLLNRPLYLLDKIDLLNKININVGYILFTTEIEQYTKEIIENLKSKETKFIYSKHTRGHLIDRAL